MSFRKFFGGLKNALSSPGDGNKRNEASAEEKAWLKNYDARAQYFEGAVGPLPGDILKMLNMTGVWPGGGLYVIPAPKLGAEAFVYTTFGFTNTDMPTSIKVSDFRLETDGQRTTQAEGTLSQKQAIPKRPGAAGYGYEFLVVTRSHEEWPVNLLQWAVNAEIGNDVGFLDRVEKYNGLTVEDIGVDQSRRVNILITKAMAPLPTGTQLPAGSMEILVATTITDEEMRWSQTNGRGALLAKLRESGVGQISTLGRRSVIQ